MANIIIRRYQHFNRAMGKWISSKKQYDEEMKRGGYIPQEEADRIAEGWQEKHHKPYDKLSDKAMDLCLAAKNMSDKKGNLKPSSRLIDGMKEVGVDFNSVDRLPKHYRDVVGGFDAT